MWVSMEIWWIKEAVLNDYVDIMNTLEYTVDHFLSGSSLH